MIPYGGDLERPSTTASLQRLSLSPGGYVLYVSRFEPENNPDHVVASYRDVPGDLKLVMVGGAPYAPELVRRVHALAAADPRVVLPGFVYGVGYRELLFNAAAYVQATEVGGTHPALVEAMGAGRIVLYLDNPPNREVVGGAGVPFRFDREPSLTDVLTGVLATPERWLDLGRAGQQRVAACYRWDEVALAYEKVLEELWSTSR